MCRKQQVLVSGCGHPVSTFFLIAYIVLCNENKVPAETSSEYSVIQLVHNQLDDLDV